MIRIIEIFDFYNLVDYRDSSMPQVSGWKLKPELWERLFEVLNDAVSKVKTKEKAAVFISSLLTSTERKMVAKRLVAAILIENGATYEQIKEILHLSTGTIARVKMNLGLNSEYKDLVNYMLEDHLFRKSFYSFVKRIGEILSPHPGKGGSFWRSVARSMDEKIESEIFQ